CRRRRRDAGAHAVSARVPRRGPARPDRRRALRRFRAQRLPLPEPVTCPIRQADRYRFYASAVLLAGLASGTALGEFQRRGDRADPRTMVGPLAVPLRSPLRLALPPLSGTTRARARRRPRPRARPRPRRAVAPGGLRRARDCR